MDDCRFVWEVNSEPSVRQQSVRTDPIPWESHVGWFERMLTKEGSLLLIAEEGGVRLGVVRFDRGPEGAVISVALRPEHRGRGLGTKVISEGTAKALEAGLAEVAIAYVRPSNEPSRRAFLAAGYASAGHDTCDGVALERFERRRRIT
jgi:ribosomal protein S18 acetylase RimI-like enzyme